MTKFASRDAIKSRVQTYLRSRRRSRGIFIKIHTDSVKENLKYFISFNFAQSTRNDLFAFCQVPPITAFLGSFGFAQRVSQDFPECILNGHSVKDILGKNILQFGFVLSELMKNCRDSNEFEEVIVTFRYVANRSIICAYIYSLIK